MKDYPNQYYWFEGDTIHFDIPEMLKRLGIPDTPENRDICAAEAAKIAKRLLPNAEVKIE